MDEEVGENKTFEVVIMRPEYHRIQTAGTIYDVERHFKNMLKNTLDTDKVEPRLLSIKKVKTV